MSGKSLKIGIAAIAILLMTVAAVGAVSAAQTFTANVSIVGYGNNTVLFSANNGTYKITSVNISVTNATIVYANASVGTVDKTVLNKGWINVSLSSNKTDITATLKVTTSNPVTVKAYYYNSSANPKLVYEKTLTLKSVVQVQAISASNLDFKAYDAVNGTEYYEVKLSTTPLSYITTETPNVIEYNYGSTFTLDVTNYESSVSGVTVQLKNLYTGAVTTVGTILKDQLYKSFTVSGLAPGKYAILVVGGKGLKTWNLSADPALVANAPPQVILVYNKFPTISITLNNPRTPIALGDAAYFTVKITGVTPKPGQATVPAQFELEGPFGNPIFFAADYGGNKGTVHYIKIDTENLQVWVDGNTVAGPINGAGKSGDWKLTVTCESSKKSVTFKVEDVSVSANVPSSIVKGQSLTIQGTTNLAETGSVYDLGATNEILVSIYAPGANNPLPQYDNLVAYVKSDGTWKLTTSFKPELNWQTGSYKVEVTAIATATQTDTETYYITVNNPTLTLNLAKEYYRGESLYIQGTSNLGAGARIQITVYGGELANGGYLLVPSVDQPNTLPTGAQAANGNEILTVYTSADGSWQTSKLYINPEAPRTTYTVVAKLLDENGNPVDGVSATGTINVVKPTLTAKLSMTNVVRGAKVTLSGTSPIDTIFLLTSDKNVFDNVGEIQTTDQGTRNDPAPHTPMVIKTISGSDTFKVTLTVEDNARYDTYTLYVIASPDGQTYDLAKDPYVQLTVTVIPAGIIYAPDTFTITQGSAKKLFIEVNAKPNDVIYVGYSLKGHGVDITTNWDQNFLKFDSNNGFTKWNETANGTYWMFVTIYPYYDIDNKELVSSYNNPTVDKLLPVGLYELTLHVYTQDPDHPGTYVESQTKTITMDVQPVVMAVTCPSEVVVGQPINVTIHENRVNCNQYDNIYVVMDLGTKLRKYMGIALNESGYAVVSIPTGDITPGTYKIYVRDTMGTFVPPPNNPNFGITQFITDYYNLSPTSGYAKAFKADDDVLVVKTVKILASPENVTPTPTPTATATPTPTPTPTPKPTATPTPKPTATPTPTPTATPTPTPTPTPKKKTPGFEAVFAIAGLIAVAYLLRRREL